MNHILNTATDVLPYVAGAYEVIVRSVPTHKNLSLLNGILKGLLFISELLNRRKNNG